MSLPDSALVTRPPDRQPLVGQYRQMCLIRTFEERAAELFQQGIIFGTAHSCVGQEAIAVGAAGVMRATDYLVGHHRSHGHLIAAGADLRRMMAEMFGKRTGYCKGLGGSMHIADLSLDILGCNGIVGAGIPHACGAALTATLRGSGQAAVAFFGDGAAGQGAVHEGMNLAATWKLPVVFICENNQFALSADWRTQRAVEDSPTAPPGTGCRARSSTATTSLAVEDAVAAALAARPCGRRADPARDEDVPPDAALDAREPPGRPRPGVARGVGAEGPAAAARGALRDAASSTTSASPRSSTTSRRRSRRRSRQRSPTRTRAPTTCCRRSSARTARIPAAARAGERPLGFVAAIREALDLELAADPDVIVIGEDIGRVGGLFRATEGLYDRYGAERIRDTPLTESGFVGCGDRRRADGVAPGRGAPVLGLRRRRLRPDHEPGGEAAVHDGRHAEAAARPAHGRRAAACGSARSTRRASRRSSRTSRGSSS